VDDEGNCAATDKDWSCFTGVALHEISSLRGKCFGGWREGRLDGSFRRHTAYQYSSTNTAPNTSPYHTAEAQKTHTDSDSSTNLRTFRSSHEKTFARTVHAYIDPHAIANCEPDFEPKLLTHHHAIFCTCDSANSSTKLREYPSVSFAVHNRYAFRRDGNNFFAMLVQVWTKE
jgi:hypothetical protein